MRLRGFVAVFTMARPARPERERELVLAAAGSIDGQAMSHVARTIAQRVIAEAMRDIDADEFMSIAQRLAAVLEPSPVTILATDADIDTGALIRAARMKRFEARGCRRLPVAEWQAEDREIADQAITTLAGRYFRYLQDFSRKPYLRESSEVTVTG
ncbi:MAG: hypothetical protein AB7G25_07975 [Sphingomonadaceae bacterium]